MQPQDIYRNPEGGSAQRLIPALVLISIGAFFLLNNLHFVYFREVVRYWPVILIAAGLVKMVDSNYQGGRVAGGIMITIGGLFLVKNMGFVSFSVGELWPLILIGAGFLMLYQRVWDIPRGTIHAGIGARHSGPIDADRINDHALFGGVKRSVGSKAFQGGEAGSMFGGVELDLRQAEIAGESATIEADAVFGGIEIKIPRHWSAVVQGTGIFGGFSDSTVQPDPVHYPTPKQLFIRGSAVFGGVEIKN
jgi:hypothetical protein